MTNRIPLYPIDPSQLGITETRLSNIPLINHLQESAEVYRLISDGNFQLSCINHRFGAAIRALNFDWYGFPNELLTLLLQKSILGTEAFISAITLHMVVQKGLVIEGMRDYVLNPMLLGGGTAESHYNRLPALIDPAFSLLACEPVLWEKVKTFYREVRNKIFHGYYLTSNDPASLIPDFEMIREVFIWMDSWYEDNVSEILPIDIKRYWPAAAKDMIRDKYIHGSAGNPS